MGKAAPVQGSRERTQETDMVRAGREQDRETAPEPGIKATADMEEAGAAAWAGTDTGEGGTEVFVEMIPVSYSNSVCSMLSFIGGFFVITYEMLFNEEVIWKK